MPEILNTSASKLGSLESVLVSFEADLTDRTILGCFDSSQVCQGFCVIDANEAANLNLAWLNMVYVDPQFRGRGVGSRLILGALDFARESGFSGIRSIIEGVFYRDQNGNVSIPDPELVRQEFGSGGVDSLKAHLRAGPVSISKDDFFESHKGYIGVVCSVYLGENFSEKREQKFFRLETIIDYLVEANS